MKRAPVLNASWTESLCGQEDMQGHVLDGTHFFLLLLLLQSYLPAFPQDTEGKLLKGCAFCVKNTQFLSSGGY